MMITLCSDFPIRVSKHPLTGGFNGREKQTIAPDAMKEIKLSPNELY
jgi:hypothetical protein